MSFLRPSILVPPFPPIVISPSGPVVLWQVFAKKDDFGAVAADCCLFMVDNKAVSLEYALKKPTNFFCFVTRGGYEHQVVGISNEPDAFSLQSSVDRCQEKVTKKR